MSYMNITTIKYSGGWTNNSYGTLFCQKSNVMYVKSVGCFGRMFDIFLCLCLSFLASFLSVDHLAFISFCYTYFTFTRHCTFSDVQKKKFCFCSQKKNDLRSITIFFSKNHYLRFSEQSWALWRWFYTNRWSIRLCVSPAFWCQCPISCSLELKIYMYTCSLLFYK